MNNILYPKTWIEAVDEAWGAFPARDLLDPFSPEWTATGLEPPDHAEAVTFGLAGRALKYSMSVALALPMMGGAGLSRLMIYLNRLRADSLTGALRTPWLNPGNIESNPDIILIARPQATLRELSRIHAQGVRAKVLQGGYSRENKLCLNMNTLVVNAASDFVEMVELIRNEARPWVFVVDGTRGGTEHAAQIDIALMQSFPGVPRLVLLSAGDEVGIKQIRDVHSGTSFWVMRNADRLALQHSTPTVPRVGVTRLVDGAADSALDSLAREFFALRSEQEKSPDFALRERLMLVGKVFRALNELSVPLHYLERVLLDSTRPGLFQINSLERLLEIAAEGSTRFGDTEGRSQQLIRHLRAYHQVLMDDALTGKAQWLRNRVRERVTSGCRTLVLCGTAHEAKAIEQWMDDVIGDGWELHVEVSAMDGVRAFRRQHDAIQDVLVTGMLWPSRQHWLAQPCSAVLLSTYRYEFAQTERVLGHWWNHHGAASQLDGDKLRFLLLEDRQAPYLDQETVPGVPAIGVTDGTEAGEYPLKTVAMKVEVNSFDDTWLDLLLAEPPSQTANRESLGKSAVDMMLIHISEEDRPLVWPANRSVLALDATGLIPLRPQFLQPGTVIILLKNHEERLATQEQLFDMVAEEDGMQQILRMANTWRRLVDQINEKYPNNKVRLQDELRIDGVDVGTAAIATWLRHRVWGPQNLRAIYTFARLAGHKSPESTCRKVGNAISAVRGVLRRLGADLNKAICLRESGATVLTIGRVTFAGEAFDQMIQKVTVTSVEQSGTSVERRIPEFNLQRLAAEVMQRHPERVLFTPHALRSLCECSYADIEQVKTCLSLMVTLIYDAYLAQGFMPTDLQQLKRAGIEFKPNSPEVPDKGYWDQQKYKCHPVDVNHHFRLGSDLDANLDMLICFQWDKDDQLLVIHYAGGSSKSLNQKALN